MGESGRVLPVGFGLVVWSCAAFLIALGGIAIGLAHGLLAGLAVYVFVWAAVLLVVIFIDNRNAREVRAELEERL